MEDQSKTKQASIQELASLRKRIAELEQAESERWQATALLRQEHESYLDLVNNQPVGIYRIRVFPREQWQKDARSSSEYFPHCVELVSDRFCEILGINRQLYETNPRIIFDLVHTEDKAECVRKNEEANAKLIPFQWEGRVFVGGEIIWIHLESLPQPIENGDVLWTGILYDISEKKQAEASLRESEELYRTLVENANDIIFRLDDTGHITFVNPAALRIMGYEEKEIIGRHYPTFIRSEMQEEAMKFFGRQFVKRIPNTYSEYPVIVKDGREIWLGQNTQLICQDDKVVAFQAVARDITERKRIGGALQDSENRYRELSIIDDLTQLYNSRHFYNELKMEIARANRYGQPLTLLLFDLDDFKAFNDTYGHIEGDEVLRRLGKVVKKCLRETDFAFRYGGEEFTILLPMTTKKEGAVTAERIRTEFKKETFSPAPGHDAHITVSLGLAQYKPQEDMKVFVHRVDQLMYRAKKNGKDKVCS